MSGVGVGTIGISAFSTAILLAGAPVPAAALPPVDFAPPFAAELEEQTASPPAPAEQQAPAPAGQETPPPAVPVPAPLTEPVPGAEAQQGEGQESDVLVTGRNRQGDPLEPLNAASFEAAQAVDQAVVGPAALAYEKNVPSPLRSGLRNFLVNLREPVVFFNFVLQLKFGKAAETAARFLLNSTVGIAGVMDVARRRPFHLPLRRNSFANTLGYWGVGSGPFFFLPLVGPTTLRDLTGTVVDQLLIPIQPIRPAGGLAYTVPVGLLSALDYRARINPDLERQRGTGDPYAALRRDYFLRRNLEIEQLRGTKPTAEQPCRFDRARVASLNRRAFDQDPKGGWRLLADRGCDLEAAESIRDWRMVHGTTDGTLDWHEGQLRANAGRPAEAIVMMERSRTPPAQDAGMGWNLYVDGTVAFLRNDRAALEGARAKLAALPRPAGWAPVGQDGKPLDTRWPLNLNVLDGLLRCWGQPYKQAYACGAPAAN